ncbi:MAG: BamA/TamA family outer membrane protein [Flavobacteriales bacterium]|nr:BamA/TamA family outer membrane protein [Flavobacteriales bacterium]MDW8410178.1 BamA/TamA family outer membrane protein [Flavobacteriales bacterium]
MGCSPLRKSSSSDYLVTKVKVVQKPRSEIDDNLIDYSYVKTNKKTLGLIRLPLQIYLSVNQEKTEKRRQYLDSLRLARNKQRIAAGKKGQIKSRRTLGEVLLSIGEPPALLDSQAVKKSAFNIQKALINEGFFDAHVRDSIVLKKNRRAQVYFIVQEGEPYRIRQYSFSAPNKYMQEEIQKSMSAAAIVPGKPFDLRRLNEERDRITKLLRQKSFFFFSKDYISFEADTGVGNHLVDLKMIIKNPSYYLKTETDSFLVRRHHSCLIRHIYVDTDYNILKGDEKKKNQDTVKGYIFVYNDYLKIKPTIIAKNIILESGNTFNADDHDKTYNYLSNLRIFKFINITYKYVGRENGYELLDCYIQLTPAEHQSLNVNTQFTTTGSFPGLEATASYTNRNAFYGAEIFSFNVLGRGESQLVSAEVPNTRIIFNTLEFGGNLQIQSPKFLVPFNIGRYSKRNQPKTTQRLALTYQSRPDYQRFLSSASFGYEWNETPRKRHTIIPADINIVNVNLAPSFRSYLESLKDKFLLNSFTSQIISGFTYIFGYNEPKPTYGYTKSFRLDVQFGGNSLWLLSRILKSPSDEQGRRTLANTPFAQYLRLEPDFRQYFIFRNHQVTAFRFNLGLGLPYANSRVLPFEKSFFAGGATDLRGFLARRVGPGSYPGKSYDQFGDIKVLISMEHRIPLIRQVELALFADAGNIWLLRPDPARPGGHLQLAHFWRQMALSAGLGLRLNLGFFIFRLDPSVPIYDPSGYYGDVWIVKLLKLKSIIGNFAIGYPF